MLRRIRPILLTSLLLSCAGLWLAPSAFARQKKEEKKVEQKKEAKKPEKAAATAVSATAEQVAETVIIVFGQRERLSQIRRTGIERGQITRTTDDGRTENIKYERSFKRGVTSDKDKIRLDKKMPTLEFSLISNEGRVWGLVKGTSFTPRQEDLADFLAESQHGLDALLRYKENGATVSLNGKDTQKGIEMWVLDLTDKSQRHTRYYVSTKTGRVLALEYEEAASGSSKPSKFRRTFHDYEVVQGTAVPKRSVLFEDDKQVEDLQIFNVIYGIKVDDAAFQTSEATTAQTP